MINDLPVLVQSPTLDPFIGPLTVEASALVDGAVYIEIDHLRGAHVPAITLKRVADAVAGSNLRTEAEIRQAIETAEALIPLGLALGNDNAQWVVDTLKWVLGERN